MRIGTILLATSLATMALAGCIETGDPLDDGTPDTPSIDTGPNNSHPAFGFPTYLPMNGTLAGNWSLPDGKDLPDPISSVEGVTHVEGTTSGHGIAVFSTLAFTGPSGGDGPLRIIDISDPENPALLAEAPAPVRDADTIAYPDGRLVVITTAGGTQQFATDVTNPTNPVVVAEVDVPGSNHNIAVVPGTPIVYNSGGSIVDYSDPANPDIVSDGGLPSGCHDITFYISQAEEKYRAYCAGYEVTGIWDITDPTDVTVVNEIPYPSMNEGLPQDGGPAPDLGVFPLSFSHLAIPNHDASVLIMGDETGGGLINGCDYYANAAGNTQSGPLGNLWFYDITDEENEVLHGHFSPSYYEALGGSCTAHFGRVIEDTNHLVMGFYAAGVTLVDFTDLDNPVMKDRYDPIYPPSAPSGEPGPGTVFGATGGSSIWDVWYYEGYLFTGDSGRGMDVLTLA